MKTRLGFEALKWNQEGIRALSRFFAWRNQSLQRLRHAACTFSRTKTIKNVKRRIEKVENEPQTHARRHAKQIFSKHHPCFRP